MRNALPWLAPRCIGWHHVLLPQAVEKVPQMLKKRKLALLPHFSSMAREVRRIFKRAEDEEKKR